MSYFARFSPFRAIADLRRFLALRQPYELWFGMLAIVLTTLLIAGFVHDSHEERVRKQNIIYVQQWPLSRTDREIIAQQKIDQAAKDKREAEIRAAKLKTQAQFKKLDDQLKSYGL